jgi:hypothetical protein
MPTLLSHFRNHLIAEGLVRKPGTDAPGTHPLYLEPPRGAPAPGEEWLGKEKDSVMVLSAFMATAVTQPPYASWLQQQHIELRYRTSQAVLFEPLEEAIRLQFVDRRNWKMTTGLVVVESGEYVRAQRLGGDGEAITWRSEYFFQTYSGLAPRDG